VPIIESRAEVRVKVDMEEKSRRLGGDGDLARLALLVLGNDDAEQAILHSGSDAVLVDSAWECERPGEFSNTAFGNPKLGLRLLRLGGFLLLDNLSGALSALVLDSSLVSLVAIRALDGTLSRSTFDEAGRRGTRGVAALSTTLDGQGVGIGELNFDILLLDSGEFAVEFVRILDFLDVELWGEGLQGRVSTLLGSLVPIEVVEHTEEWLEGEGWVGGKESSWEERHLALGCCWLE